MATVDECRAALRTLAERLDENLANGGKPVDLDRPLACTITDLGVAFHGQITGGRIVGLTDGDDPNAKIRLTSSSDDLVALIDGKIDFLKAFASGRIGIKANMFDMLKLKNLL
jgi:predicted lipid carrier protein YhbT